MKMKLLETPNRQRKARLTIADIKSLYSSPSYLTTRQIDEFLMAAMSKGQDYSLPQVFFQAWWDV